MKNFISSKRFMVAVMVIVMLATTVFSFAYWLQGLHGSNTNGGLDISVGSGNPINSQIIATRITAMNQDISKKLIPYNKASLISTPSGTYSEADEPEFLYDEADYTAQIKFGYRLEWFHNYNTTFYDEIAANLRISYKVFIGEEDVTEEKGLHGSMRNLFQLDFSNVTTIMLNTPVEIEFSLTMDEPKDKDQYYQVTDLDRGLRIELFFDVETTYDIG